MNFIKSIYYTRKWDALKEERKFIAQIPKGSINEEERRNALQLLDAKCARIEQKLGKTAEELTIEKIGI